MIKAHEVAIGIKIRHHSHFPPDCIDWEVVTIEGNIHRSDRHRCKITLAAHGLKKVRTLATILQLYEKVP